MNDKQRAEFERWVKPWGWCTDVDSDGYYEETPVQMAWNAWQASIASVVVELPKIYFDPYADERTQERELGKEIILDEVESALDKAGIRYE